MAEKQKPERERERERGFYRAIGFGLLEHPPLFSGDEREVLAPNLEAPLGKRQRGPNRGL
jgi:hypothetical protein